MLKFSLFSSLLASVLSAAPSDYVCSKAQYSHALVGKEVVFSGRGIIIIDSVRFDRSKKFDWGRIPGAVKSVSSDDPLAFDPMSKVIICPRALFVGEGCFVYVNNFSADIMLPMSLSYRKKLLRKGGKDFKEVGYRIESIKYSSFFSSSSFDILKTSFFRCDGSLIKTNDNSMSGEIGKNSLYGKELSSIKKVYFGEPIQTSSY